MNEIQEDLLSTILSFLDTHELIAYARLVNRHWKDVSYFNTTLENSCVLIHGLQTYVAPISLSSVAGISRLELRNAGLFFQHPILSTTSLVSLVLEIDLSCVDCFTYVVFQDCRNVTDLTVISPIHIDHTLSLAFDLATFALERLTLSMCFESNTIADILAKPVCKSLVFLSLTKAQQDDIVSLSLVSLFSLNKLESLLIKDVMLQDFELAIEQNFSSSLVEELYCDADSLHESFGRIFPNLERLDVIFAEYFLPWETTTTATNTLFWSNLRNLQLLYCHDIERHHHSFLLYAHCAPELSAIDFNYCYLDSQDLCSLKKIAKLKYLAIDSTFLDFLIDGNNQVSYPALENLVISYIEPEHVQQICLLVYLKVFPNLKHLLVTTFDKQNCLEPLIGLSKSCMQNNIALCKSEELYPK